MAQDLSSLIGERFDFVKISRKRRSGWNVGVVPSLVGGINDELPANLIDDSESPFMENLSFLGGSLKSDTGYIKFSSALNEVPKGMFEHKQADDSATRLCVTNKTVYKYNITHEEWHVIKGVTSSTLSVALVDTDLQVTVVSDAGFTVGAVFGIVLDTGKQLIRTVATLPGANVITFTGAATGGGAAIGNDVIEGAELAGDDVNQIVFMPVPGNEWTVFTNGIDPPFRYDSTADTVVTVASLGGGTLSSTTVCKTLAMYRDTLILLSLVEASVFRPYKLQWAKPGDPTIWNAGNAGNNSLLDSRDHIIAAKPIGSSLAIYRSNSIVSMNFQGSTAANAFFRFDTSIAGESTGSQGVGAVSPNAVFALPDEAIVLTADGVYLYRGGFSIELLSNSIFKGTFGVDGDMDNGNLGQNFVHFADRTNEVFFFYRSNDAVAFPDKALILNLATRKFRKRTWFMEVTSAGNVTAAPVFVAIDDLVGSIDEQSWLLGGNVVASGKGTILLGTIDATPATPIRQVMEYNYISPRDDGRSLFWTFDSKDFDGVDRDVIMDWIEFEFGSVAGQMFYSTDSGQTWSSVGPLVTTTAVRPIRGHINKTARKFRFRIIGAAGGGEIKGLSFRYKEAYVA